MCAKYIYMHWTDRLHRDLIAISDVVNRLDVDVRLLASTGVSLDRALFPLLSRVAMNKDMNVAELANLVGRDHSTVSRQIVKLERLGLLDRASDPKDQRSRHLTLSKEGQKMMAKIDRVRRLWTENHFSQWEVADRERLIDLMDRMLARGGERSD